MPPLRSRFPTPPRTAAPPGLAGLAELLQQPDELHEPRRRAEQRAHEREPRRRPEAPVEPASEEVAREDGRREERSDPRELAPLPEALRIGPGRHPPSSPRLVSGPPGNAELRIIVRSTRLSTRGSC